MAEKAFDNTARREGTVGKKSKGETKQDKRIWMEHVRILGKENNHEEMWILKTTGRCLRMQMNGSHLAFLDWCKHFIGKRERTTCYSTTAC